MTPLAIVSAFFASLISLVELFVARGGYPTWRAGGYVLGRAALDASGGMVAYSLVSLVLGEMAWFTPVWAVMLAALCGPALLRSQLSWLGSGQEEASLGPATVLRRVQRWFENQISEIDSAHQTNWMNTRVLPRLSSSTPAAIAARMKEYVEDLKDLSTQDRAGFCEFLDATLADTSSDDEKRRAMAWRLHHTRGRRWLDGLAQGKRTI